MVNTLATQLLVYRCTFRSFIKDRIDLSSGTNPSGTSTYYYGDARKMCRDPPETRELKKELPVMLSIAAEDVQSLRRASSKMTGYTGLSILHRFHSLFGFDVIRDLVFDEMHNLPLNVARQHLRRYVNEKLFDTKEVQRRLQNIPWTAGELHGCTSHTGLYSTDSTDFVNPVHVCTTYIIIMP